MQLLLFVCIYGFQCQISRELNVCTYKTVEQEENEKANKKNRSMVVFGSNFELRQKKFKITNPNDETFQK